MRKQILFIALTTIFLVGITSCSTTKKHASNVSDVSSNVPQIADAQTIRNTSTYIEATSAAITGDVNKAEKLYQEVLDSNPEEDGAWYELARIFNQKDELAKAEEYASKAIDLKPDNQWYLLLLGEIYQKQSNYKASAEIYEKLVEIDPGNPDRIYTLANLYIYSEELNKALREFERLEEIVGVSEEIANRKIKIFEHQKKQDKALNELQKLADANPTEIRYRALLAEKLMSYKREDEAFIQYTKIREMNPNDPYIHITLAEYYRKKNEKEKSFVELKAGFANESLDIDTKIQILLAYYTVSEIYQDMNPEAYELLHLLVETHPKDPKAWSMYGDFLFRDNNPVEAAAAYAKVLEFDKSKFLVWEGLMYSVLNVGRFDTLNILSKEAIELFPNQPSPLLFQSFCYINENKYSEAIPLLKRGAGIVVNNDPLKAQFYSSLGDCYYNNKENKLAYEAYDKCLLLDPDNSYVLNNYSYFLSLDKQDLEKAEIMAKKGLDMDPENANNMDTYGWVLYQMGKYEEAQKWIWKSLQSTKHSDSDVLEHYGDVMYRLNDVTAAVEYWQKALKNNGEKARLERKIETRILTDEE